MPKVVENFWGKWEEIKKKRLRKDSYLACCLKEQMSKVQALLSCIGTLETKGPVSKTKQPNQPQQQTKATDAWSV